MYYIFKYFYNDSNIKVFNIKVKIKNENNLYKKNYLDNIDNCNYQFYHGK